MNSEKIMYNPPISVYIPELYTLHLDIQRQRRRCTFGRATAAGDPPAKPKSCTQKLMITMQTLYSKAQNPKQKRLNSMLEYELYTLSLHRTPYTCYHTPYALCPISAGSLWRTAI